MKCKTLSTAVTAAALAFGFSSANADIVFDAGPGSAADTDNVIANACSGNITGPALMVQGCLNSDHSFFIDFTGNELLRISGGQADITAVDGDFNYMKINTDPLATSAFTILSFNVEALGSGNIEITATETNGNFASATFALSGSGSNFFHIDAINGEVLRSVSFTTTVGLASVDLGTDLQQVRIGGGGDPLPEPGALALFGVVLGACGMTARRRTRAFR